QELFFRNTLLAVSYPRSLFFYIWFFSLLMVTAGRELNRMITFQLRVRGLANDNLLIVGAGKIARDIAGKVKSSPELGYNILGVVTAKDEHQGKMLGISVLGNYADLPDIIDRNHIEQVIIALPDARRSELVELVMM